MDQAWLTTIAGILGYGLAGAMFVVLTNVCVRGFAKKVIPLLEEDSKRCLENAHLTREAFEAIHQQIKQQNQVLATIEEMIVLVHQDIMYLDQDLDDIEERIIRLEYRPTKQEPTTIETQALPPRVEMPLRRMRELRRRRRG
jgi:hypothetical protein